MNKNGNNSKMFLGICVGFVVGICSFYAVNFRKIKLADELEIISECEKILSENGVEKIDELNKKSLLNGYLESYDKYTYYYENEADTKEFNSRFVNGLPTALGSGFTVEYNEKDELIFTSVEAGMSAAEQGIAEGDKIISIDGELTSDNNYEFVRNLAGKEGTICNLVIERDGMNIQIEFVRHNDKEKVDTGVSKEMYGSTLYLAISEMSSIEGIELNIINNSEFDSIIFDLRNNPGGQTQTSVNIADRFVGEGYLTEYYKTGEITKYKTEKSEDDLDVPIVVITNEKTASSAEVLTAFLKQYGDATIVGTKTFGKGIFQTEEVLGDGYLHFTAGYFTVGDWECWQGKGIAPDIEVEMDSSLIGTDEDIQLQKALEVLENELG